MPVARIRGATGALLRLCYEAAYNLDPPGEHVFAPRVRIPSHPGAGTGEVVGITCAATGAENGIGGGIRVARHRANNGLTLAIGKIKPGGAVTRAATSFGDTVVLAMPVA